MKIIRISVENRTYNGIPFKYFTLFGVERGERLVYGCSGSTMVVDVDVKTNEPISGRKPERLDKISLQGAEILVWKNDQGKVVEIDRLVASAPEEQGEQDIPF